jgi:hypothetical protein
MTAAARCPGNTARLSPSAAVRSVHPSLRARGGWRPIVSEQMCPDCYRTFNDEHGLGCQVGRDILDDTLIDEAADRFYDEARDDARGGY